MKSMPTFTAVILLLLSSIAVSGCLTADRKLVRLTVNEDGSGSGVILYQGLASMQEDESNESLDDYNTLIERYLKGDHFEQQNPSLLNIRKRLFEENGLLNGAIAFDFEHFSDVGLYRHDTTGLWLYYVERGTAPTEQFAHTNGHFPGPWMPVAIWEEAPKAFELGYAFDSGDRPTHSLLSFYRRLGGGNE